jgi:hypothetical protein
MAVSDADIWRAAHLMTVRHGDIAELVAAQRADELLEAGDTEGEFIWRRIAAAIAEWQRQEPQGYGKLNWRLAALVAPVGSFLNVRELAASAPRQSQSEAVMVTQYTVGLRLQRRSEVLTIGAEDALIAALKAKHAHPDAIITYVRKSNRRGDRRHPHESLSETKE